MGHWIGIIPFVVAIALLVAFCTPESAERDAEQDYSPYYYR